MDILDILFDILLKPPQPFIGLFLIIAINDFRVKKCSDMERPVTGALKNLQLVI